MISRNVITNTVFSRRSYHAAPRNAENLVVFLCKSSEETLALALFIPSAQSWLGGFHHFLLFNILALGLVDEKEVGCLRYFVMSSTSWHHLVEEHAHFFKVIIGMIMISSSNILVSMHLKTLITSLCCSDTLNQRNTNVYLVYHRQTHCYFCTTHYLRRVS